MKILLVSAWIFATTACNCFTQTSPPQAKAAQNSLILVFHLIPDEKQIVAGINYPERRIPTQFLVLGNDIPYTDYTIIEFIPGGKSPTAFVIQNKVTRNKRTVELEKPIEIEN